MNSSKDENRHSNVSDHNDDETNEINEINNISSIECKNHVKELNVDENEERRHFQSIVNSFRCYRVNSYHRLAKTLKYLDSLPEDHRNKLVKYRNHLQQINLAIDHNYEIIKLIIGDVSHMFENIDYSEPKESRNTGGDLKPLKPSPMDIEKVHSVLKQIVREWTAEGARERNTCYKPILDAIDERYSKCPNLSAISILVPGAGLGRLAFDIASRGYTCQGNEYSLFMLIASNFILNKCKGTDIYTFYPWVHQYHNNVTSADQLTRVTFPDSNPSDLLPNCDFSMAAGNFVEIYTEPNTWDCIATCFFIDTANNVVAYIETIWNILKPGGVWINIGPLLYHYADLPSEESIEPSYEVVRHVILEFGFKIIEEKTNVSNHYTQNSSSMLAYEYRCVFFQCQKPLN